MKDKFTEAIRLMKLDLAYFEEKYQGKFLELPHIGLGNRKTRCVNEATLPIRLSDGGDFENVEQVEACFAAARRHSTVNSILYTKRVELLEAMKDHPANVHVRYSSWDGDEKNTAYARSLGYDVTYVVSDGTGNCPYQKSLARFNVVGESDWAVKAEQKNYGRGVRNDRN